MSDAKKTIVCDEHGHREGTIVCRHVGEGGERLGFNRGANPDDRDELWPVAWCDACEATLVEEGEWNDRSLQFADLRLLCSEHYELVRRRNWRQDDIAYAKLSTLAMAYLERRQAELHRRFPLGDTGCLTCDESRGEMTFSNRDGTTRVIANFQIVGALSSAGKTWMWSWASPSDPEPLKKRIRVVRAYGEEHDYRELVSALWPATDEESWRMTAIAAYLLGADGAHRILHDDSATFMVLSDIRWVD